MPQKITAAEAKLPAVRLIIPRDKFRALPAEIQEELAYFEVNWSLGRYLVPGYRFADWVRQLGRQIQGGDA